MIQIGDGSSPVDPWNCGERIDYLLDLYVGRWPQFADQVDDPDWRNAWADHFGKTVYRGAIGCHFVNPIRNVLYGDDIARSSTDRFTQTARWCGRWRLGQPFTVEDQAIAALVELAFEDVIPDAYFTLDSESESHFQSLGYLIGMNPDVALLLAERSTLMADPSNLIYPIEMDAEEQQYARLNMVSDARRVEVKAAARSGDWRSILETTAPCRPRNEMLEEAGLPPREY